jgi:glucans biosynthesis protein C
MAAVVETAAPEVGRPARVAQAGGRLYYMDWLRVIIIGMVFVAHVMMPFSGAPWLITAEQKFPLGSGIAAIGNQFAMPVMFFLAGAGAYFSLRRRSSGRYARERLMRLGVPFVLFTLLLSPVQSYYAARNAGTYSGPFFPDYLPHFFNLDGFTAFDLSWIGHYGYHLWFLGFLLFFSLAAIPIFRGLDRPGGKRLTDWLARLAEHRGGLLLLFLPFALLQIPLFVLWPDYQSWANTAFWAGFFVLGYLFYTDPRFAAAIRRDWKIWAWAAGLTVLILVGLAILGVVGVVQVISNAQANPEMLREALANPGTALQKLGIIVPLALEYSAVVTVFNYNAWALALLVMAFGISRLNFNNRTLQTTGQFSMPFYVIHHPFVVILGFYIVQLSWEAIPQMLFLGLAAFIATTVVVWAMITPRSPLRVVFGMPKAQPKSKQPAAEPAEGA